MDLHQSVVDAWWDFSTEHEGYVIWMYVDVFNYVTTGVGNLIDTPEAAAQLPWRRPDGSLATTAEVKVAWGRLKYHPGLTRNGKLVPLAKLSFRQYAKQVTGGLYLEEDDIKVLVWDKLMSNARYVTKKHYPDLPSWPADAQMAAMSMAWAVGPGFPAKFVNFSRVAQQQNWRAIIATDAKGSWAGKIRDGLDTPSKSDDNVGIVPRNANNKLMFTNAAVVKELGLDLSKLYWPGAASAPPELRAESAAVFDETTQMRAQLADMIEKSRERMREDYRKRMMLNDGEDIESCSGTSGRA